MYRTFNAQFPRGYEFDSLQEAVFHTQGWLRAWVEDENHRVVHGERSQFDTGVAEDDIAEEVAYAIHELFPEIPFFKKGEMTEPGTADAIPDHLEIREGGHGNPVVGIYFDHGHQYFEVRIHCKGDQICCDQEYSEFTGAGTAVEPSKESDVVVKGDYQNHVTAGLVAKVLKDKVETMNFVPTAQTSPLAFRA